MRKRLYFITAGEMVGIFGYGAGFGAVLTLFILCYL